MPVFTPLPKYDDCQYGFQGCISCIGHRLITFSMNRMGDIS